MWSLYKQAKSFSQRPSKLLDVTDKWAAYQFDEVVNLFGMVIENALAETIEVGTKGNRTRKPKYTLKQLLAPAFRLPLQQDEAPDMLQGVDGLLFDEVG